MANTTLEKYVEQTAASVAPLKQESIALLAEAKSIKVTNTETLKAAIEIKKVISKQAKSVEVARKQFTAPLDDVKRQLLDLEKDVMVELDEAKVYIGGQIIDYEAEQQRLRDEEIQRVNNFASEFDTDTPSSVEEINQLGAEQKKLYSELSEDDQENPIIKQAYLSSVNRLTSARADIEERARQAAEDERLAKIAAEQSAEAAALAKQKADNDAAARKIERDREELAQRKAQQDLEDERRAREAAQARADKDAPKTNTVTTWKFEVTDISLLPKEYLMADESKIGATVRASKGGVEIPGVKIYSERKSR